MQGLQNLACPEATTLFSVYGGKGMTLVTCLVQATLAAANVAARLRNKPVYNKPDILPFVEGPLEEMPKASPSIVNAEQLGLSIMS